MTGYERLLAEVRSAGERMGQEMARDHLEVLRDQGSAAFLEWLEGALEHYRDFEARTGLFAQMGQLPDGQIEQAYDAFDSAVWDGVRAASGVSR